MPYSKYKESRVNWIGNIPSHWEVKKLKYVALVQPSNVDKKSIEGEIPVLLCNYMDVYKNEFIDNSLKFMEGTATPDEIEKFRIEKGDVLVTKDSETANDIAKPAFVNDRIENVICGYHLTQIRPRREFLLGEYLFRLFEDERYNGQFEVEANGVTRFGLSVAAFSDAFVSLPPIDEQTAIANYLNSKASMIDRLIAQKERIIELLQEKRQALINEAVTRGLDKNVKLKDSGIEWLGKIPGHWEVKKLRYLVSKIGSGVTPTGGSETYLDQGIPLFRSQNIYNDGLRLEDVAYISMVVHNSMSNTKLKAGDVLLNITGASIGRCFYFDESIKEANVNQHVCIIRPIQSVVLTRFLHLFLCGEIGQEQINLYQTGANREGLNNFQLGNFQIPLPSKSEQEEIIKVVNAQVEKIDGAKQKIELQIEKLREFRQSLISEVVTGKVDVREEANSKIAKV